MSAKDAAAVAPFLRSNAECRSMNGYAVVRVAIKSANHRFLDIKTRIPESLELFEHQLRWTVQNSIRRGHVDVHITLEPNEELSISINRDLLKAYVLAAENLRYRTGGKTELNTVALLRLPGVIGATASVLPESEERQKELGHLLESLDR
jgi:uncharacterized protein (TIGR00255 family)